MKARGLVLLDRDGVVNAFIMHATRGIPEPPRHARDVTLFDGAATALLRLQEAGFDLAVVTNQPGAAKGEVTHAQLDEVRDQVIEMLRAAGVHISATYECRHRRPARDGAGEPCDCRKPAPGLLTAAMHDLDADPVSTFLIGDGVDDVLAAQAAGVRAILLAPQHLYVHEELCRRGARPAAIVDDPEAAAEWILEAPGTAPDKSSEFIHRYLSEAARTVFALSVADLGRLVTHVADVKARGGRVFFVGAGGSAANATHAAADFRKFLGIDAHSVSENISEVTARVNDEGWDDCYAGHLQTSRLQARDLLFVLSVGGGSVERGVSTSVVRAAEFARSAGTPVVGIVGRDGGDLLAIADALVVVPTVEPARVTPHAEALQAVIWHLLVSHPELADRVGHWESLSQVGGP